MAHLQSFDVIIVVGGVIESSITFFLADPASFTGSVLVVEKDPTLSTARSLDRSAV